MLDHGYTEQSSGKKADWFTTNGDVFPVGKAKTTPFPPVAPSGSRSFPRKNLRLKQNSTAARLQIEVFAKLEVVAAKQRNPIGDLRREADSDLARMPAGAFAGHRLTCSG